MAEPRIRNIMTGAAIGDGIESMRSCRASRSATVGPEAAPPGRHRRAGWHRRRAGAWASPARETRAASRRDIRGDGESAGDLATRPAGRAAETIERLPAVSHRMTPVSPISGIELSHQHGSPPL